MVSDGLSRLALAAVPGVPETVLPDELLDRLPAGTPPPPWSFRVRAVVWLQRSAVPLPAGSSYRGKTLPVTVAAVVEYLDSPVGPYREIFAGAPLRRLGRPAVHVPFIAVDSLASLQAGRAYWSLPKTLASFDGAGGRRTVVSGASWSVEVAVRALGPPLPLAVPFRSAQDGRTAPVAVRGTVRPGLVRVSARGATLGGWLGDGLHAGFVARGRIDLGPAGP
jgi:acetoacetate decarboxylase